MIKKNWWNISPEDSSVCFRYGYEGEGLFQGNFRCFTGSILADETFSSIDLKLHVESETIKAVNQRHNAVLLSDHYFNSEKYPAVLFDSGYLDQPFDGKFVNVQLTLKGINQVVRLMIVRCMEIFHRTEYRTLLTARAVVSASEFKMGIREWHDPDQELMFDMQLILTRPQTMV